MTIKELNFETKHFLIQKSWRFTRWTAVVLAVILMVYYFLGFLSLEVTFFLFIGFGIVLFFLFDAMMAALGTRKENQKKFLVKQISAYEDVLTKKGFSTGGINTLFNLKNTLKRIS